MRLLDSPTMKRRTFLKQATVGTALSSWNLAAAARTTSPADPIKVGVITQENGPHLSGYLRSLAEIEGVEEVAISDESGATFLKARESLGRKVKTFRSHEKMLEEFRPPMTLISLAADLSPPLIQKSLEANCHVLTEKPSCTRAEDFEPLVRMAESRDRHLMMAFYMRRHPGVLKAQELMRSGFIGKPFGTHLLVVADQTRLTRPKYQNSWLASKGRAGGGQLIWLGIHYIDLIQLLTGDRIEKVSAIHRNVGGQPIDTEDAVALNLQFERGMVGTYHGGYYLKRGYHLGFTIWGSQGWFRLDEENSPLEWYSTHPDAPEGVQSFPFSNKVSSYQLMVQSSVNAARGVEEPPVTGAECLSALQAIFSAYRAAESGVAQSVL